MPERRKAMSQRLDIIQGDCLTVLRELPDESVQCCVTSPPYWGLRDYGVDGQLGLEKTPEEYVAKMVEVFREVRRVLREDGVLWLNLGDSYNGSGAGGGGNRKGNEHGQHDAFSEMGRPFADGLKPKDLCGIPWRVAFALQSDGWWLRQDIIWHKPNPMPESVTDRCTKAHEYVFLLSKSARYYFDAEAIKEQRESPQRDDLIPRPEKAIGPNGRNGHSQWETGLKDTPSDAGRNKRSVWTVPSNPYSEAHFATFPPDLIKPCILAGTSARGCCPTCGAPWERVVARESMRISDSPRYGGNGDRNDSEDGRTTTTTTTTGWAPACECVVINDHVAEDSNGHVSPLEPIPCTVLDPFGGSGTTGMVAIELGRKAILIELNPAYVKLIEKRTHVTPGLALA